MSSDPDMEKFLELARRVHRAGMRAGAAGLPEEMAPEHLEGIAPVLFAALTATNPAIQDALWTAVEVALEHLEKSVGADPTRLRQRTEERPFEGRPIVEAEASVPPVEVPREITETLARAIRMPTAVLEATIAARAGQIASVERTYASKDTFPVVDVDVAIQHWTLVPREGTSLVLPLRDADGITVENVGKQARMVLTGGPLMTYLTTWALWDEQRDFTGIFLVEPKRVADLRGISPSAARGRSGGGSYGRFWQDFRRMLNELCQHGVQATAEIKALHVEPLIQFYEHASVGTYYRHAPILMDTLRSNGPHPHLPGGFAQVPILACRLDAHAAPLAYGFAKFWRAKITSALRGSGFWRGTLRELAQELAAYSANEERKRGSQAYWPELADHLARVAREGDFGELAAGPHPGPDAIVTLVPSAVLASVYQRLLDAQDAARHRGERRADEVAVRRALGPKRKPRGSK